MKKEYQNPSVEIIIIECDVLTASSTNSNNWLGDENVKDNGWV